MDEISEVISPLARRLGGPPSPVRPGGIIYNFDKGSSAPETFPIADVRRIILEVIDNDGPVSLDYYGVSVPPREMDYGYTSLRERIAGRIGRRDGKKLFGENIILTSGSIQGIALAVAAFVGPGDGAIVEDRTFAYAVRYLEGTGAEVARMPLDRDGMNPDDVEQCFRDMQSRGVRPKFIYTVSTFHYPIGVCLSLERRKALLQLANRWNVIILEDAIYADFRYEGKPLPTMLSLDESGCVLQSDSFSKKIAPGFRVGWIAGSAKAVEQLATVRQDLGVSQFFCRVLERYLSTGHLEPQLERVNKIYKEKRDFALSIMLDRCAPHLTCRVPEGGFFLWFILSNDIDWEDVRKRALEQKVWCRPNESVVSDTTNRFLRCGYTHQTKEEIELGLTTFANALVASRSRVTP